MLAEGRSAGAPVLLHASTDLVAHGAGPGVVWYRCELSHAAAGSVGAAESMPFVVEALEAEGKRLQEETAHPLFKATHVRTNHGVLGGGGAWTGDGVR